MPEPLTEALDKQPLSSELSTMLLLLAMSLSLTLLATGCSYWLNHPMLIYCDQGLFVSMAQLLLEGRIPYVDMFDVNPPLAIYFQVIPVLVSKYWHIPIPLSFSMYIYALAFVSCLLSGWVLLAARKYGALLLGLCALVAFAYFNQVQRLDFGQREHIFCIVYAPFFFLRYLRWEGFKLGRYQAIAVGLFAGVGLAFKPHFMIMACAPEIVWWLRTRKWRPLLAPEVLAAVAVIVLYLFHFIFLPAQELKAFFQFVVPIYKEGYSYYVTSPIYNMATCWRTDFFLLALTSVGALALARYSSLAPAACAFSFISALIYVLAGQVWSCHMVAVRLGNAMAVGVELFLLYQLLPASLVGEKLKGTAMAALAVGIVGGGYYLHTACERDAQKKRDSQPYDLAQLGYTGMGSAADIDPFAASCLENTQKSDTILFICASMAPGYPVMLQTERRPASRFLHGMMLPILSYILVRPDLSQAKKDHFSEDKDQVIKWYAEDIAKNRPKLIYIQDNPMNWVFENYNFIDSYMHNYRMIDKKDGISIYKRND